MRGIAIAAAGALLATGGAAQSQAQARGTGLRAGRWDVVSTVAVLSVPGVPGFLQRMARGRSTTEHKRLATGQGVDALLAPDPKATCRIDAQQIADGRYRQMLTCPQKRGEPMHIVRTGSYDAGGFTGEASVDGTTGKGALHIVLRQRTVRTGD